MLVQRSGDKKADKKKKTQKSSPELRDLVRVFLGFSPEVRVNFRQFSSFYRLLGHSTTPEKERKKEREVKTRKTQGADKHFKKRQVEKQQRKKEKARERKNKQEEKKRVRGPHHTKPSKSKNINKDEKQNNNKMKDAEEKPKPTCDRGLSQIIPQRKEDL